MKQDRLNNCLLMHCHKSITDTLATMKIAKRFACANEQRKGHLKKKSEEGYEYGWVKDECPPPSPSPPHELQQLIMHLFCFNPPTLRAKYEFKHIEIDLLLAPVVQKVDSAIHRINLYPQDGAIAFPNIYPLDTDIHLLNNWGQLCTWRHGRNFGGQEQKHFSSLGTELYFQGNYSEKLTTNMNIYLYSGRLRVWSPHYPVPFLLYLLSKCSDLREELHILVLLNSGRSNFIFLLSASVTFLLCTSVRKLTL